MASPPQTAPAPPQPLPSSLRGKWVIVWDGDCDFCGRAVAFALRRERTGLLTAVPHQQCLDWLPPRVAARAPEQFHLRSPRGEFLGGGAALTRLLALLGHPWLARVLETRPARPLTAAAYRWVAHHRGWVGRFLFRP